MSLSGVESQKRLLIVDDEQSLRFLFAMALQGEGYLVDEAESGRHALKCLESNHYDLVLLDLRMPGLSGLDVLDVMRARHDLTRVAIVSAYLPSAAILRAASFGVTTFLSKPMTLDFFRRVVDEELNPPRNTAFLLAREKAAQLRFSDAHRFLREASSALSEGEKLWMRVFYRLAKGSDAENTAGTEAQLSKLVANETASSVR